MRQPQPFFRKFAATWYVQLGKQKINLGKDEKAAYQKYFELLANRGRATNDFQTVGNPATISLSVIGKLPGMNDSGFYIGEGTVGGTTHRMAGNYLIPEPSSCELLPFKCCSPDTGASL